VKAHEKRDIYLPHTAKKSLRLAVSPNPKETNRTEDQEKPKRQGLINSQLKPYAYGVMTMKFVDVN